MIAKHGAILIMWQPEAVVSGDVSGGGGWQLEPAAPFPARTSQDAERAINISIPRFWQPVMPLLVFCWVPGNLVMSQDARSLAGHHVSPHKPLFLSPLCLWCQKSWESPLGHTTYMYHSLFSHVSRKYTLKYITC